jgi:hypothetical protein
MSDLYVKRVISELRKKSDEERTSHFQRLDWILEQISRVPSPEKESLLVYLMTSPHTESDTPSMSQPQSSL